METETLLLHLFLILVSARVLGEIADFLGAPAIIGELSAGIVLGPSLLGWVELSELIRLLGEIGIILLLFEVGLETDMNRLIRSGTKSVIVAVGGFVAPMAMGFALTYFVFDQPLLVSLFVGGTLTATSIGITVRTLQDIGLQSSPEGQITLGAAVLDDVLGVVLLALLYEFSVMGGINWLNAIKVLLFVCAFFFLAPALAKLMSQGIRVLDERKDSPGLIPVTIIALVLFFGWLAHWFGAPELLGGFAAGLALSRRFFLPFGLAVHTDESFGRRVSDQMKPIVQIFTPIFFVGVGLSMDLSLVDWTSGFFWWFSMTLLGVAIFSKYAGALFIHEPWERRIAVGMAMVPRGEIGLIFAGLGSTAGIFTNEIYTVVIMVIVYTTLLSPFWIKLYYRTFAARFKALSAT